VESNQQPCRHPLRSYCTAVFGSGTTVTLTAVASQVLLCGMAGACKGTAFVPAHHECESIAHGDFNPCRPSIAATIIFMAQENRGLDHISMRCALLGSNH